MRFVLRLRPDVHRALDPAGRDLHSAGERAQAFSTYLHETIHWWQHTGSTLGLILSLLHPAQLHFNKPVLDRVLRTLGPVKPLRKYDEDMARARADAGASQEDLNVVLNNWHDIEFFRHLVIDPQTAERSLRDLYFDCAGHCYEVAITSFLWLLSATFDPHLKVLPDPRKWESEFTRLRAARAEGFHDKSAVYLPPCGARALFEGQARFSQIQYLHTVSGGTLTWDDLNKVGMLRGIYREAFDGFLEITKAEWPRTPADPLVGLFLLVCDLALNPNDGFPSDLLYAPALIQSLDPGLRFLMLCQWIGLKGREFLSAISRYSKDEYLEVSAALSKPIVCDSPARIGETLRKWSREHLEFQRLLQEDATFDFSPGNLPVRVFFARFLRFQLDKLENPQFFCWPGMWLADRPGVWTVENARQLFSRHEALFMDGPDGSIYPRVLPQTDSDTISNTFNNFYAVVTSYELTRQWMVEDGPFDFDFSWLTTQYPQEQLKKWASDAFEVSFGTRPEAFKVL